MRSNGDKHIFFVDDEPDIRLVVAKTLRQLGTEVTCFARATDCLEQLRSQRCDLLITDVKMPGMDGITLLVEAKRMIPSLPVLVITGYGDVPMAVKALKVGAVDFIEKPLERQPFLSIVKSILARDSGPPTTAGQVLTKTETKVLGLILDGKNNKEISRSMCRSTRTIEDHRAHIMRKLGVDNLIGLVKRIAAVRMPTLDAEE